MTPFFFLYSKKRDFIKDAVTMANNNGDIFLKFPIDGQVNIETWYFDNIFLLVKHEIFSILGFIKYFLTSSALQAFVPRNLCLLLLYPPIINIPIVSFSRSLNRVNVLNACHKLELTGNAQNLSPAFI